MYTTRVLRSLNLDRDDVLSDLIWIRTVCKGCEQTLPLAADEGQRTRHESICAKQSFKSARVEYAGRLLV